ncbi:NADP oxidoreductase, coenzyme F420-dependent [Amycolatopsis decaplanina DSM 44594]|uniref:NADP oxidoreductase, coenzyme F420-dependent n=2 Tax=Amycolatopsis decaplanina TaxID=208441 RepID=M2X9A0_9PSEU|nr:NAD(P)-binding domain-containing protein [Amycolatopsis decaplanina]EME57691.1 NADP oxidoreductase, coenzyme F420-dependent [Amycolatopsis decaplanina DSM 44594]
MRIGIFGAGGMAEALGGQWAATGHEVMIAARDQAKADALAGKISARAGTWEETARASEVILLAVPAPSAPEVLAVAGKSVAGKMLIDCTNAVGPGATLTAPDQAARIAAAAPDAHVVKAFNLCDVDVWRMTPPVFGGRPLAVPLCGSPEAVEVVSSLVRDIGCTPLNAGGLDRARLMEATMAFMVGLWFDGHDAQACFPPLPV